VSGCSRACEKIVLQPPGQDGAKNICDIVRFMFVCKTTLNDMGGDASEPDPRLT